MIWITKQGLRKGMVRGAALAALAACSGAQAGAVDAGATAPDSAAAVAADSVPRLPVGGASRQARPSRAAPLPPLADSIARRLTFVPIDQPVLTAATRGGRWLVDVGRVDTPIKGEARSEALRQAAAARAPIRLGDTLTVFGPFGVARVPVSGFDSWSGRIVAVVHPGAAADSLARAAARRASAPKGADVPYTAAAFREAAARDSIEAPVCQAVPAEAADSLDARVRVVGDSLASALLADTVSAATTVRFGSRTTTSHVDGCFGDGVHRLVLVALRGGNDLYMRERAALVADDGSVQPLAVSDYRFRAHVAIDAYDADGDGVDDVAVRGYGPRVGSLVILRLDREAKRLVRLTGGFAYEN